MKIKNKKYDLYETLQPVKNFKDLVSMRAELSSDKVAFSYNNELDTKIKKTFGQVAKEVNCLGTWLFKQGYKAENSQHHIAVLGDNSYNWLLSFLSITNGGNVAVPIDKDLSESEVMRIVKKADVEAIFIDDSKKDLVKEMPQDKVFLMSELATLVAEGQDLINKGFKDYFAADPKDEDDCIIIFTSGTSGQSKGAELTNRNIGSELTLTVKNFILEGNTVAVLPFHHAFGLIVGIFMVYYYGQETFINKNLRTISKALVTEKPHTMFLVPLFVEAFHKQIWRAADKQKSTAKLKAAMTLSDQMLKTGLDLREKFFASVLTPFGKNLKYIICGGAALDPFYVKEFRSWGIEILNGYGMTECSPVVSVNRNLHHKDGTVGLGIPEAEFMTAEDEELLVRGPFLMKGYYKDPEITAEAITEDGWYHTGDLGHLDSEGFIHLTGRKKNLIILSTGENISPEELEGDISIDEGVNEVLVYEDNGQIVAEIFPEEAFMGNATYFDKLIKKINHPRPAYKHITEVRLREEEFPKNSTHKILRKNWGKK